MKRGAILSYVLVITMIAAMLSACGKETDTEAENVLDSTISSEITTEAAVSVDDVEKQTESESEEPTETTESTEPDKTTEASETSSTTESASEPASEPAPEQTNTESVAQAETAAPEQTEELPGINRNGRYADIPESVLPASVIGNYTFLDEPRKVKVWEDLLGQSQLTNIYTDYTCTTILKPVEKDEIFYELTSANYGGDGTPGNSTDVLALYNDQYVFISDPVFQDADE